MNQQTTIDDGIGIEMNDMNDVTIDDHINLLNNNNNHQHIDSRSTNNNSNSNNNGVSSVAASVQESLDNIRTVRQCRIIGIILIITIIIATMYIAIIVHSSTSSKWSLVTPSGECPCNSTSSLCNNTIEPKTPPKASERLIMQPVLRAGLTNQICALQALIEVAAVLNATVCWPRTNYWGQSVPLNAERQQFDAPFEALFDKEYFRERVKQVYGVRMVDDNNELDQQFCDYVFQTRWKNVNISTLPMAQQYEPFIEHMPEVPYDRQRYEDSYHRNGKRFLYFERMFQQWVQRELRPEHAGAIQMMADDVLRPTAHLQKHVDTVFHYYDNNIIHGSPVIGIHLRIEGEYPQCGTAEKISHTLCDNYELPCRQSTCIIATGAPLEQYEHALGCAKILTKHGAWPSPISGAPSSGPWLPLTLLSREENAVIDLWTVTRAHVVAGCGASTFSMSAYSLHDIQLAQWKSSKSVSVASDANAATAANYLGDVQYEGGCTPGTQRWFDNHRLNRTRIHC